MRVLLGLDILLMMKDKTEDFGAVGLMMQWLDTLRATICVDFATATIASNLNVLPDVAKNRISVITKVHRKCAGAKAVELFSEGTDAPVKPNSNLVLALVSYLQHDDADLAITNDLWARHIASAFGCDDRIFTIDDFIDKCALEHRDIDASKGLVLEAKRFGDIDTDDTFFDSFRADYPGYAQWLAAKASDNVFVSRQGNKTVAFLKLKTETDPAEYADISPALPKGSHLKISSFKVQATRTKLAERFMRLIFNEAVANHVNGIYVTMHQNSNAKHRLRQLLEHWGFKIWGTKPATGEAVLFRPFPNSKGTTLEALFPHHSTKGGVFIVPLRKSYCDALLGTQTQSDTVDIEPLRNAITKVLILRTVPQPMRAGSMLLFYAKTHVLADRVIAGTGIVSRIHRDISDREQFMRICRKHSIFTNEQLDECWQAVSENKFPTLVEFLYVTPATAMGWTEDCLVNAGIATVGLKTQDAVQIDDCQVKRLISNTGYERDFIAC